MYLVEADIAAREILYEAAADDTSSSQKPLGICILGRPTQGKTRLAWEAMQAELPTWTFIMWPYEPQTPFDFTGLRGKRVVLWLDDIHKFANTSKASTLNDLPRQFANAGIHLVIVATCRDGDDKVQAHKYLGDLLEHLTEVHLTDLSEQEATNLLSQMKQHKTVLQQKGVDAQPAQFDGTPGSLLLGVRRMREQRYPRLPDHAKQILRAMKLLYSAGIYTYPASRVRQTAVDIFGFDQQNWRDARDTLIAESFVRVGPFAVDNERIIDPVADIYLEQAVPDYPAHGASVTDEWFLLRESLTRHADATGLLDLGTTAGFDTEARETPSIWRRFAEVCLHTALQFCEKNTHPFQWAIIQNNLGGVLQSLADFANGATSAHLLEQSEEAYSEALQVYTKEHTPILWATTQANLGGILSLRAHIVEGTEGEDLLKQAVEAYRVALSICTQEEYPILWSTLQSSLGVALLNQAQRTVGVTHANLLKQAFNLCQSASQEHLKKYIPIEWAQVQSNLGNVLCDLASQRKGTDSTNLLVDAIEAYRNALQICTQERTPTLWAAVQNNLGTAL